MGEQRRQIDQLSAETSAERAEKEEQISAELDRMKSWNAAKEGEIHDKHALLWGEARPSSEPEPRRPRRRGRWDATAWTQIERRAAGGPIEPWELYLVGKEGPQLFVSQDAGHIYPHERTINALSHRRMRDPVAVPTRLVPDATTMRPAPPMIPPYSPFSSMVKQLLERPVTPPEPRPPARMGSLATGTPAEPRPNSTSVTIVPVIHVGTVDSTTRVDDLRRLVRTEANRWIDELYATGVIG